MYSTGNPVPSSALEDMADNAQVFDGLVTKTSGTVTDRLGNTRRVFQQIVTDMGFNPVSGSFQAGATITEYNQCLLDASTGTFYSWSGALPKVVAAGSTPATAGGVGALLWVDRTDLMLRNELVDGGALAYLQNGRFALRDIISIKDYGAVADYDISTRTIVTNSTQAMKDALAAARLVNGHVLIPDAPDGKAYYFNETIYPHAFSGVGTNPSGYYGTLILGSSRHGSYIVFDVPAGEVGLHIFGTSGGPSNLGYKNLTIRPHVDGVGIGVCEQGPCVIEAENCDIQNFEVNLKLSNGMSPGIFTEFGTHRRLWLKNATVADLQFRKDGGDASFHGANFEHVIINTKSGAVGVDIGTGCYIYNAKWHMNLFGETGAKFILNNGIRNGDDALFFEGTAMVENFGDYSVRGMWRVENGTGKLSWGGTKPVAVENLVTPITPSSSRFSSIGSAKITELQDLSSNSIQRNFVGLRGTNVESIGAIVYGDGDDTKNGLALLSAPYSGGPSTTELEALWHLEGITGYRPSFKLNISNQPNGDQLSINESGRHSGRMGRHEDGVITGNAGVPQEITTNLIPVSAGQPCHISIRVEINSGQDWSAVYLGCSNPYATENACVLVGTTLNIAAAGFSAPSSVKFTADGRLKFTVTTQYTVNYHVDIIGIGSY